MNARVVFADVKLKKAFDTLKDSRTEDKKLYEWLERAFRDLEKDAFCGVQIQKRLIPEEYTKRYGVDNLWKYDLPNAWRLIYSVAADKVIVISIIIEWMDHKNYEKRFKY